MDPVNESTRDTRTSSAAEVLDELLGRTLDLGVRARHARWNVTATAIRSIHAALGRLAKDLDALGNRIAERAAQLGVAAPAMPEVSCGCTASGEERDCLTTLTGEIAALAAVTREAIQDPRTSDDRATRDVLSAAARTLERWRSYMERHVPEFA